MSDNLQYERCWVIGAGVLGSSLAAVLHRQGRVETHLVGSSPHLLAIKQDGLLFEYDGNKPFRVPLLADLPGEVPPLGPHDLVVLLGKTPGLSKTSAWLADKLPAGHAVIALQNGMGFEEKLARDLGCRVERGFSLTGATNLGLGHVRMFPRTLVMQDAEACRALALLLEGSPLSCELAEDYKSRAWFKLAVNCVANSLAGILDSRNSQLMHPMLDGLKDAILAEVREVAQAEGVELSLTAKRWNEMVLPGNVPSLRIDLQRGFLTEIDTLNGAVVQYGKKHGIATPVNQSLVDMVHYLEQKPEE